MSRAIIDFVVGRDSAHPQLRRRNDEEAERRFAARERERADEAGRDRIREGTRLETAKLTPPSVAIPWLSVTAVPTTWPMTWN